MKFPLESAIADGYRFLFTRIVSVIGTVWLPYLVLAAIVAGSGWLVLPHDLTWTDFARIRDSLTAPTGIAARGLISVASLVVGAMVMVNLMRHSLGLKEPTTWIYFSLGAPVWRMAAAIFLAGLIFVIAIVVIAIAGVAGGYAAFQRLGAAPGIAAVAAIAIIAVFLIFYTGVRLFFFLPAVVVAENRIGIGRAFALSSGNFWRAIVVWLAISAPVWFVVGIALQASVLPVVMAHIGQIPRHPTIDQVRPLIRAIVQMLPVILSVAVVAGIAVRAFLAGAIGSAYKAVNNK